MTIAISGTAGSGAAEAAPAVAAPAVAAQPNAGAAPAANAGEDAVKISAAAQEVPQPMSVQVRALHNQGQSVAQIASKLAISASSVQSYLGTPPAAAK
jgi:DNA-directed RNA polymerase specialized sigma24 family protein